MTKEELTEKLKDLAWQMHSLVKECNAFLPPEKKWEIKTHPYDPAELSQLPYLDVSIWPDSVSIYLFGGKADVEYSIKVIEKKGE